MASELADHSCSCIDTRFACQIPFVFSSSVSSWEITVHAVWSIRRGLCVSHQLTSVTSHQRTPPLRPALLPYIRMASLRPMRHNGLTSLSICSITSLKVFILQNPLRLQYPSHRSVTNTQDYYLTTLSLDHALHAIGLMALLSDHLPCQFLERYHGVPSLLESFGSTRPRRNTQICRRPCLHTAVG
ncbi:uncharacterized protein EI97DRAFT_101757 [Westerdykella ornata]|uniref:Uncharacterized protein n=1 Tax=Westerdykella ornata TaxID=318751 RepID=A0A6A6JH30_WESOR|nr:uncharacterized protein EI97DRAFT_101757 [Westerdykella ornata]KAF2274539.1 hypothetical protein EI97DRAFT_101757 [Westerdykella ornata]